MSSDAFKAAEQRGYAKGYAAGKRAKAKRLSFEGRLNAQKAFRQRAFLAVLPWCFEQKEWGRKVEGVHTKFTTVEERVGLAWDIARDAVNEGVKRGVV